MELSGKLSKHKCVVTRIHTSPFTLSPPLTLSPPHCPTPHPIPLLTLSPQQSPSCTMEFNGALTSEGDAGDGRGRKERRRRRSRYTHTHTHTHFALPPRTPTSHSHLTLPPPRTSMDDTMLSFSADCLDERPDTVGARLRATTGSVGRAIGKLLHRSLRTSSSSARRKSFPMEAGEGHFCGKVYLCCGV